MDLRVQCQSLLQHHGALLRFHNPGGREGVRYLFLPEKRRRWYEKCVQPDFAEGGVSGNHVPAAQGALIISNHAAQGGRNGDFT